MYTIRYAYDIYLYINTENTQCKSRVSEYILLCMHICIEIITKNVWII